MKINILTAFICGTVLVGCATLSLGNKYSYDYQLVKPDSSNALRWEDDKIAIAFTMSDKAINFTLRNRTKDVMKLIWDEATIMQFGKAQKVMHAGVKYINRNEAQPPATIPPGTSIDDMALPSENVYYREGYYGTYYSNPGGWEEEDLFPTYDLNKPEIRESILGSKGQKLGLYLPIQYQGKTIDYTFEFSVTDVRSAGGQ